MSLTLTVKAGIRGSHTKALDLGTADLLTFTNSSSGTSVTYDVVIVGASA